MNVQKKIGAVIVARQGSTRFPKKAMVEMEDIPVIGHIIRRLKACAHISEITIATSTNEVDDEIEQYGIAEKVKVFRGHPEDVMRRIASALQLMDVESFVEIGGDCPLVSPDLLNVGIQHYLETNADIVSNALLPPFNYPVGYDFILVKKSVYLEANNSAELLSERFQPFQYIIKHPEKYSVCSFTMDHSYNQWRWTLDYKEDFDFISAVYQHLYKTNPNFGFEEIKMLLQKNPELLEINKMHVDPVTQFSAWSTGSYVKEMHQDIKEILDAIVHKERDKKYEELQNDYEKVKKMIEELVERAKSKMKE